MTTDYKTRSDKYFLTRFWGGTARGTMFQLTSVDLNENFNGRSVCLPLDPVMLDALIRDLLDLKNGELQKDES